jgi:hypothetical protein
MDKVARELKRELMQDFYQLFPLITSCAQDKDEGGGSPTQSTSSSDNRQSQTEGIQTSQQQGARRRTLSGSSNENDEDEDEDGKRLSPRLEEEEDVSEVELTDGPKIECPFFKRNLSRCEQGQKPCKGFPTVARMK